MPQSLSLTRGYELPSVIAETRRASKWFQDAIINGKASSALFLPDIKGLIVIWRGYLDDLEVVNRWVWTDLIWIKNELVIVGSFIHL